MEDEDTYVCPECGAPSLIFKFEDQSLTHDRYMTWKAYVCAQCETEVHEVTYDSAQATPYWMDEFAEEIDTPDVVA